MQSVGPAAHIIINADDLGYSAERDDGIFHGWSLNAVTSASLLVNGRTAKAAAARALTSALPIGLHFNLTEGEPVCAVAEVPTLVGADGLFRGKVGLWGAAERGDLSPVEVQRELRAQLRRFRELSGGAAPTHCDGHQHVHVIVACGVAAAMAATLREAGVHRTRIPYEPSAWLDASPDLVAQHDRHAFCRGVARCALLARPLYAAAGIFAPRSFVGNAVMGAAMSETSLRRHLRLACGGSGGGTVELMVHPGHVSRAGGDECGGCGGGAGPDAFATSPDRAHELAVLCAHAAALCAAEGLERRSFVDAAMDGGTSSATPPQSSTVVLLAQLRPLTGNCVTALRLRAMLRADGFGVVLVDACSATSSVLAAALAPADAPPAVVVVALHLRKCASLLLAGLARAAVDPVIVVCFAGTDVVGPVASSPSSPSASFALKSSTELDCKLDELVRRASAFVAFHRAMGADARAVLAEIVERSGRALNAPLAEITIIPQAVDIAQYSRSFESVESGGGLCEGEDNGAGWLRTACCDVGCVRDAPLLLLPCGVRAVKDPCFLVEAMAAWHREARGRVEASVSGAAPTSDGKAAAAAATPPVLVVVGNTLEESCARALHAAIQRGAAADADAPGGDGEDAASPRDARADEMARCGVVVLGSVPRAKLLRAVALEAAAVVNSSRSEGQPMAVLEAMALGTPVLARCIGANIALLGSTAASPWSSVESSCADNIASTTPRGMIFATPEEFVAAAKIVVEFHRSQGGSEGAENGLKEGAEVARRVVAASALIARDHSAAAEASAYSALLATLLP